MRLICLFVLSAVALEVVLCGRDFYKILNVSPSSTKNQVKKAYRNLAKQLHPDKNRNDPNADERFRDLNAAYQVLSDEGKRKIYDKHGEEGLKEDSGSSAGFGSPFSHFFGDFFDFGDGRQKDNNDIPRGGDILMDIDVTLEELYSGNFVEVIRNKPIKKTESGTRQCNCRMEMRTHQLGPGRFQMMQEQVCDSCPNFRYDQEEKLLEIEIEPGMRDGQVYPFIAEGEPHNDGDNGDLKFRVKQMKHPIFHRRGDDIYTNLSISLLDALNGFATEIYHLDGHKVVVKREKVTWPNAVLRKTGEGMPNYENNRVKGSMFVTFNVNFPKGREMSEEEKASLAQLFPKNEEIVAFNGIDPIKVHT